jgi:hypothetical protein
MLFFFQDHLYDIFYWWGIGLIFLISYIFFTEQKNSNQHFLGSTIKGLVFYFVLFFILSICQSFSELKKSNGDLEYLMKPGIKQVYIQVYEQKKPEVLKQNSAIKNVPVFTKHLITNITIECVSNNQVIKSKECWTKVLALSKEDLIEYSNSKKDPFNPIIKPKTLLKPTKTHKKKRYHKIKHIILKQITPQLL